jgi:hypothetical protein
LIDCKRELSEEDRWPVLTIIVKVILSKAGINAIDNIVEVLVNQHHSRAKDNKVEVDDCYGVVEV